jgi:ribokinase
MRDIVVVGSLNVDVSLQATRIPQPGETVRAEDLSIGPGGKGLNQATGSARLGARVHMVGCTGDDRFADVPENAMREAGIDASYVERIPDQHTGTALIIVEKDSGQNAIAVAGGANHAVTPEDVRNAVAAFRSSGVLLVQLELPLEAIETALDLARENALVTVLDPAPARELPDTILRKVDILTPNETEVTFLTGVPVQDVESAAKAGAQLQKRSLGDVLVTLGAAGCVWVRSTGFAHVPAPRVDAIDTTAAGDAFNAGLAVELARGKPVAGAIDSAIRTATASTLRRGAAAAMPTPQEVETLLTTQG